MAVKLAYRPNLLGDLTAEADGSMLDAAFLETSDYRTLIETADKIVVVGRRGTGKSALNRALVKHWNTTSANVIGIAPEEHQIIGVRPLVQLFGDKFTMIRAGTRLLWRYTLMMEALQALTMRARFASSEEGRSVETHLKTWKRRGANVPDRFRNLLKEVLATGGSPEERIGDLPKALDITRIEDVLAATSDQKYPAVVFLVDRLDEGYEPDVTGIGLVDGLIQAAIDLKVRISNVRLTLFLRDNIFRAVKGYDPDYSRTIEGHVLRLHWDENALFNFVANRMRVAFDLTEESSLKIWNASTAGDLKGRDGFAKCLRLTLYRPRDILSLLNQSFSLARNESGSAIALAHIDGSAKEISQNRLEDLLKEYSAILPGLANYVAVFDGQQPERDVREVAASIEKLLRQGSDDSLVQQDFLILDDALSVIRGLFSVGFVGVRDSVTGRFVFCHDGRAPDREFDAVDRVLVHPCYWIALNAGATTLEVGDAEDIYDEYDIEIASETPHIRAQKLQALIDRLNSIPEGEEGAPAFEAWCHKAIQICFAKSLRNVELHPNRLARQRRDVIGTNLGETGAWKRIRDDYQSRQVIFEIKNYQGLTASDYQQIQSYLGGEYGRVAFAVTRDEKTDLYRDRDVQWLRDVYMSPSRVLIVKLTANYFRKLLHKLRSPPKHDAVDDSLHSLLDTYTRLYLAGQTMNAASAARRERRKRKKRDALLK